jgi:DNA polymerase-1
LKNKILVIDFNNMVHRARSGFNRGEHYITYTFLLMIRKTVEKFSPSSIYIVKEGHPQSRHEAFGDYKSGRSSAGDDFWRQHSDILHILQTMPVNIVRHPDHECDDMIAHIVNDIHKNDECVIVSTDTDFIQLLSESDRIKLWNPIKDSFVENFECDYVQWKSLVGDGSDNIPGFKGIGAKTAKKLLSNPERLKEFLDQPGNREKWERNLFLISFHKIEEGLEWTPVEQNWDNTLKILVERGFTSIVNDKSWKKYINTFSCIEK